MNHDDRARAWLGGISAYRPWVDYHTSDLAAQFREVELAALREAHRISVGPCPPGVDEHGYEYGVNEKENAIGDLLR